MQTFNSSSLLFIKILITNHFAEHANVFIKHDSISFFILIIHARSSHLKDTIHIAAEVQEQFFLTLCACIQSRTK